MADIGFIKFYRSILSWEWYHDINVFRLFTHLLLKANYEDKKWKGIIVRRGQYVTSLRHLSEETGLSLQHTRSTLDKLKSTQEITCVATQSYTLITVVNFEKYQQRGCVTNTEENTQLTHDQHRSQQQLKNIRNKEVTTTTPESGTFRPFGRLSFGEGGKELAEIYKTKHGGGQDESG